MILRSWPPQEIKEFLSVNPIKKYSQYSRSTRMGGLGDRMAPVPIADIFFDYLWEKGELFSQWDFIIRCVEANQEWFNALPNECKKPWQAKVGRNFYPSFIDSLHVWALLHSQMLWNGKPVFDKCSIDTKADVKSKTDLILHRGDQTLRVGLMMGSRYARESSHYKQIKRDGKNNNIVTLILSMDRSIEEGNKRWYSYPHDFKPLFQRVEQLYLPGFNKYAS